MSTQWHFTEGGSSTGPHSTEEIEGFIRSGRISSDTLVWHAGIPNWEPVGVHFDVAQAPPEVPQGGPAYAAPRGDGLYAGAPARSFGEAIRVNFQKYATFRGRASRSEYWWFVLFSFLGGSAASIIDVALFGAENNLSPLNTIFSLALILPTLAVSVRRLHDIDRTGWWIGGFYLAMLAFFLVIGLAAVTGFDPGTNGSEGILLALVGIGGLAMLAYIVLMLVFTCTKGTPGPNRYG